MALGKAEAGWVEIYRDLVRHIFGDWRIGDVIVGALMRTSPAHPYPHVMLSFDPHTALNFLRQHAPPPPSDDDDDDDDECLSDKEVVSRLKTKSASEAEGRCCVCLDELFGVIAIATLDCGHEFHIHCITPWLRNNCRCPLCRAQVLHI